MMTTGILGPSLTDGRRSGAGRPVIDILWEFLPENMVSSVPSCLPAYLPGGFRS